jgi:hypothetical protein
MRRKKGKIKVEQDGFSRVRREGGRGGGREEIGASSG